MQDSKDSSDDKANESIDESKNDNIFLNNQFFLKRNWLCFKD